MEKFLNDSFCTNVYRLKLSQIFIDYNLMYAKYWIVAQ